MFARLRAVAPTLLKIGAGAGVIGLTSNVVYAQSKSTPQDEDLKLELPELTKENLKLDKEYSQYLESQEGTYRSNSDESDDPVFSIPEKDQNLPSGETKDPQNPAEAYNPETGEIDWDCPCLGGMAQGPCGEEFKQAFSCFIFSKSEVRGAECLAKFGAMQSCFKKHPEVYAEYLTEEDK